jgi:hypothetical protein
MADTIKPGTILIAEGALLPESLLLESEPYAYGWRLVKKLDSNGLDQIIKQAGWNFFYIAGVIETNAFGSDEKKTTRKAIKRIIANPKSKNFNCLEITRVAAKRSLGLPYVSVSAHSRHIQEGRALSGEREIESRKKKNEANRKSGFVAGTIRSCGRILAGQNLP